MIFVLNREQRPAKLGSILTALDAAIRYGASQKSCFVEIDLGHCFFQSFFHVRLQYCIDFYARARHLPGATLEFFSIDTRPGEIITCIGR
jgi:hypothetical protein